MPLFQRQVLSTWVPVKQTRTIGAHPGLPSQTDERCKIAIQVDEPVEINHHPYSNHDHARKDFDFPQVGFELFQEPAHLVNAQTQEQKWQPHTERVEQKE